jgi:proteasome lid subunit RPN8/RPN11
MSEGVVRISSELRDQMLKHILSWLPEEACGLLAGKDGRVARVFPVENAEHSPVRFRMDPEQQVCAFEEIEERELELLAIFHSHPMGPAGLSATDLAEAAYPGVWHVIWSRRGGEWLARAYVLEAGETREVLLVADDETSSAVPG